MKEIRTIRVGLASALLGASFTALAALSGASAADLPPPPYVKAQPLAQPANDWSGFYAGVHAGYGWGQSPTTVTPDPTELSNIIDRTTGISWAPGPDTSYISGALGGFQAGYNIERTGWLAGLEADLSYAGWRSSAAATGAFFIGGQFNTAVTTKLDWFGTVRGRLGTVVTPALLIYGTGGLAYGEVNTSVVGTNLAPGNCGGITLYCASGATSGLSVGWTAGAGLEYAFAPAWSLKAEYLHVDLGSRSVTYQDQTVVPGSPPGSLTARNTFRTDLVELGLNYRLATSRAVVPAIRNGIGAGHRQAYNRLVLRAI
jgi:outer membrane immunogenic protein